MMTDRFQLMDFNEVVKLELEVEGSRYWEEHTMFVVDICGPRIIGSDGGEPEDQRLYRDWAWVVPALNKAYQEGLESNY